LITKCWFYKLNVFCLGKIVYHMFYLYLPLLFFKNKQITNDFFFIIFGLTRLGMTTQSTALEATLSIEKWLTYSIFDRSLVMLFLELS
jgi:hypothetical protein